MQQPRVVGPLSVPLLRLLRGHRAAPVGAVEAPGERRVLRRAGRGTLRMHRHTVRTHDVAGTVKSQKKAPKISFLSS